MLRSTYAALGALLSISLMGCGSGLHFPPGGFHPPGGDPGTPVSPNDPGGNISGNWIFAFTPAANTPVLNQAVGSIDESGGTGSQGQFTTSVLVVTAPCYSNTPIVPTQGFVTPTALTFNSFEVNGQFLGFTGTITKGGSVITGSYNVQNGCANGASGTLAGSRFMPLTGTYAGPVSGGAGRTVSLALTQSNRPDGDGTFLLAGTAAFGGFGCFTSGTSQSPVGGRVSGPSANMTFVTNETSASTVSVSGTFDLGATAISQATYTVKGGACDGQTGTGTFQLRS